MAGPFSRRTVIKACAIIASLGHSDLTQFFNELGIEGFDASQGTSSRHARAMMLATYYSKHPQAQTAEGDHLSEAIVTRAIWIDRKYPEGRVDAPQKDRDEFWESLRSDGYYGENGKLFVLPDPGEKLMEVIFGSKSVSISDTLDNSVSALALEATTVTAKSKKVFVVHGRDEAALDQVELFLHKLKLEPLVLHRHPNKGRSILTKFNDVSEGASFAVVLMMPEDKGSLMGEDLEDRARQNVVFELGYFIGKLGPENVCALMGSGVSEPSDFKGIGYVSFGKTTNWKNELAKELRAAGVPFDAGDAL